MNHFVRYIGGNLCKIGEKAKIIPQSHSINYTVAQPFVCFTRNGVGNQRVT